ncbi:MAG: hypothetical protein ACK5QT_03370 [Oligoflexia bacterium]
MREKIKIRLSVVVVGVVFTTALLLMARHLVGLVAVEGPRTDLDIVIQAAARFLSHEPVYRLDDPFEHTKPPLLMGLVFWLPWVPHFWVRLAWDCVVFVMPFLILREGVLAGWVARPRWGELSLPLAWVVMYPFWYKEAGDCQYNLFIFWLILVSARWLRSSVKALQPGAGALTAVALVLKPTQVFLVPWIVFGAIRAGAKKQLLWFAAGALALLLALAGVFIFLSSPSELWSSHLEWFEFMRHSTLKHLMGSNNYGLPTLLARMGLGEGGVSPLFTLLGLTVVSVLAGWKSKNRVSSLEWSVWVMLAFSPMSWISNFGVFLFLALDLSRLSRSLQLGLLGLICLFLVSRTSEHWLGPVGMEAWGRLAAPLWLTALALVCRGWGRGGIQV